ncbi:S41 family peptidase [bacterium]
MYKWRYQNLLIICLLTSSFIWSSAQESPIDTLQIYSKLTGDYEYYLHDRYNRLKVYIDDKTLMVDERGYPHLVMTPVHLDKLKFKAQDDRRHYTFQFQGKGEDTYCIWNTGSEDINCTPYSGKYIPVQLTEAELQADFRQMRRILRENHPLLYEFTDSTTFSNIYEKQYSLILENISMEEFFRIAVPYVERVGCSHTNLWMPEGWLSQPANRYFPLKLRMINRKAYAANSSASIPPGSQVLSINGRKMSDIMNRIEDAISADGFNSNRKLRRMEKMFPFQYTKQFGRCDSYSVRFLPPNSDEEEAINLQAVPFNAARQNIGGDSIRDFKILKGNTTAVLTLNHFNYYRQINTFIDFVDSVFQIIHVRCIQNLILDLRDNDGGDPFAAAHLFSYLLKKPAPYFSKSFGKYARLAETIPLAENRYHGNLYILINGMCMSTTGHLCALLKYYNLGTFIGEETGATYTCNDGKKYLHLKNTHIQFWVATLTAAVAVEGMPKNRGISPDHPVQPVIEDLINRNDTVMEYTLSLIAGNN